MLNIDRRLLTHFDWGLFALTLIIPLCGLVVLYSAGFDADATVDLFGVFSVEFASAACLKQGVYLVAGVVIMVIGMSVPTQVFHRYAFVVYAIALMLLCAVAGFGVVVNGSRRWLNFGGFNLQPAEFMKLALILTMARVLSKSPPKDGRAYRLTELVIPGLLILVPMGLIMQQPDLGTALSLGIVGVSQVLFVGVRPRVLLLVVLSAVVLAYPSWHLLHDYQQRRILVLLDPEADPQGSGYHITQSKIAVGSGELFGKGYRQGTQTQLEFLPEHTTDFVFSVLAEEWGFVGTVFLIMLFFGLLSFMLRVAHRSRDMFACLLAFGITAQFFAHIVINIGMVIGLMPVVGIPLPLVSYGGSAMLSLMFGVGIVQGVSMRRTLFRVSP
jgi:rod shape determining protein RodA